MYIKGSPIEIQTPTTLETDKPRLVRPAVCYHPTVLFRHLRLISHGEEKVARVSNMLFYFLTFRNIYLSLKLCG
jgi:hypothetical protein